MRLWDRMAHPLGTHIRCSANTHRRMGRAVQVHVHDDSHLVFIDGELEYEFTDSDNAVGGVGFYL